MRKISKLLTSNRALLLISFLCTVIAWFSISILYSPITSEVIHDVQIVFPLDKNPNTENFEVYTADELKVKVSVSGKKYFIKQLDSSYITVTANLDQVNTSGEYLLDLSASKAISGDFTIESISPPRINVLLDIEKSSVYDVSIACPNIQTTNDKGYTLDNTFKDKTQAQLTVEGPSKEIDQIAYARAMVSETALIEKSTDYVADIELYNKDDTLIYSTVKPDSKLRFIDVSYKSADVTSRVLMEKSIGIDLSANVKNAPVKLPPIKLYEKAESTDAKTTLGNPIETISIKGEPATVATIEKVSLSNFIDFSRINLKDKSTWQFELKLDKIEGIIFNNYAKEDVTFIAVVDLSEYVTADNFTLSSSRIITEKVPTGKKVTAESLKGITVIGLKNELDKLTSNDIVASVDCSSAATSTALPAQFKIANAPSCFVVGTDLKIDIKIN